MVFLFFQEDFYSTALKTLITMSTVVLLGLIVAYHSLEVQVRRIALSFSRDYFVILLFRNLWPPFL
jgi:hypothetical protein